MNPRLKSSKKWTSFPKEYSKQIESVFKDNFSQYLDNAELLIEGRIYPEEIVLRVGYLESGRLVQANFEVSVNYSPEGEDALKSIHSCVDAAASMMMEYLENDGEVDFPYSWKEYPFQGKKVFLQYSSVNTSLEEQANQLLGLQAEEFLHEDETDEDALSHSELSEELSPPRDEEDLYHNEDEDSEEEQDSDNGDDDKGPRMFGKLSGKKKPSIQ